MRSPDPDGVTSGPGLPESDDTGTVVREVNCCQRYPFAVSEAIKAIARKRKADVEPVYTIGEVIEHPQLRDRDYFQQLDYSELGQNIRYPGCFSRFSDARCQKCCRAPFMGEHNIEIYHGQLGIPIEELIELRKCGVI